MTESRTVFDIDEELLAQAAEILGTSGEAATVNAALARVVRRQQREEFAVWVKDGGLSLRTAQAD